MYFFSYPQLSNILFQSIITHVSNALKSVSCQVSNLAPGCWCQMWKGRQILLHRKRSTLHHISWVYMVIWSKLLHNEWEMNYNDMESNRKRKRKLSHTEIELFYLKKKKNENKLRKVKSCKHSRQAIKNFNKFIRYLNFCKYQTNQNHRDWILLFHISSVISSFSCSKDCKKLKQAMQD